MVPCAFQHCFAWHGMAWPSISDMSWPGMSSSAQPHPRKAQYCPSFCARGEKGDPKGHHQDWSSVSFPGDCSWGGCAHTDSLQQLASSLPHRAPAFYFTPPCPKGKSFLSREQVAHGARSHVPCLRKGHPKHLIPAVVWSCCCMQKGPV